MSPWIVPAVLAVTLLLLAKSRWNYLRLPELPALASDDPGIAALDPCSAVTVIIPARNEAQNIARVVATFPGARVIVVDDASQDDTAAEARAAGAEVIAAPPVSGAIKGKPNACQAGADMAETTWLLFVDADTWYQPGFLPALIARAESARLDFLTVFLQQVRVGWAERCLLPYAFGLYFCGVNARGVNSAGSREALANGQCLLVRRSAYQRMGGHAAVSLSVIEDVALAQAAKAAGLRLEAGRAEHFGNVRMYDSLAAIWRGFEKNSFRFLQANPLSGVQVIAASILLTSWLPLLAWSVLYFPAFLPLVVAVPFVGLKPWYGSWRETLWAPVAVYLFQLIALSGMFKTLTGRKTLWKGREV